MWRYRHLFFYRAAVFLQILRCHRTIVAPSYHSLQSFCFCSSVVCDNAPPKIPQWMLATRGTLGTCVDICFWSSSGVSLSSDSPYFYRVVFVSLQSFGFCWCVVWQRTTKNSAVDDRNARNSWLGSGAAPTCSPPLNSRTVSTFIGERLLFLMLLHCSAFQCHQNCWLASVVAICYRRAFAFLF